MPQPFIAFDPIYAHPLPKGHRFPMLKYELIPAQLLHEGTITESALFSPSPIEEETILQTHDADYWARIKALALSPREVRAIGFPLSGPLVEREVRILQGPSTAPASRRPRVWPSMWLAAPITPLPAGQKKTPFTLGEWCFFKEKPF